METLANEVNNYHLKHVRWGCRLQSHESPQSPFLSLALENQFCIERWLAGCIGLSAHGVEIPSRVAGS
jgi:hypothetical protein